MKKKISALIGAAIVLVATPAVASQLVAGPFKTYGGCSWFLTTQSGQDKHTWQQRFSCEKINGSWWLVYD